MKFLLAAAMAGGLACSDFARPTVSEADPPYETQTRAEKTMASIAAALDAGEYAEAAALVREGRKDSIFLCQGAPNAMIDSVFPILQKLHKISRGKPATEAQEKRRFDAMMELCRYGLFGCNLHCNGPYGTCARYADSVEARAPGSEAAAYARYRIIDNWRRNEGSEYCGAGEPPDWDAYLRAYPNSIHADSVRYLACMSAFREHALDADAQGTLCAYRRLLARHLPLVKSKDLRAKLLQQQKNEEWEYEKPIQGEEYSRPERKLTCP
jgi:hypothetical protein